MEVVSSSHAKVEKVPFVRVMPFWRSFVARHPARMSTIIDYLARIVCIGRPTSLNFIFGGTLVAYPTGTINNRVRFVDPVTTIP